MNDQQNYQPPYTLTPAILSLVAQISELVEHLSVLADDEKGLRLRRVNRIRTIQGSLAIEGNTLSEEQITAILDGKHGRVGDAVYKSTKSSGRVGDAVYKSTKSREGRSCFSALSVY